MHSLVFPPALCLPGLEAWLLGPWLLSLDVAPETQTPMGRARWTWARLWAHSVQNVRLCFQGGTEWKEVGVLLPGIWPAHTRSTSEYLRPQPRSLDADLPSFEFGLGLFSGLYPHLPPRMSH